MRMLVLFSLIVSLSATAQTNAPSRLEWSKLNSRQQLETMRFTTPAYRKEALRLMLQDANKVARELNLTEPLPIAETNLLKLYISPPYMAQGLKTIGNIATSNYVYSPYAGHGFSLVRTRLQAEYSELQKQYLWPTNQMNTNAAYQVATQLLSKASMSVEALNRDCRLTIRAFTPEGEHGAHFVPVYWVSWSQAGKPVASVELCEPTKTVRQMHISNAEYILRPPLQITNLEALLSDTNAAIKTNAPSAQPQTQ